MLQIHTGHLGRRIRTPCKKALEMNAMARQRKEIVAIEQHVEKHVTASGRKKMFE